MPKIMIIAGEASGDILAADVMRELKLSHPNAEFMGVGGTKMTEERLNSIFPISELTLMGLTEVLPHIPKLMRRGRELTRIAEQEQPDILLTVDSPDFTLRVAKKIKRACPNIKAIHYVSPSVWAWRRGRVNKMAKFLDHVLTLFPFECDFYKHTTLACTHVGHPVVRRLRPYRANPPTENRKLAILPGSRPQECIRHWPTLLTIMQGLAIQDQNLSFVIPIPSLELLDHLPITDDIKQQTQFVTHDNRYEALATCTAALTKSGTSNLELAVLGIPMVVFYATGAITAFVAQKLLNVPYVSPVNWVLGQKSIPEFLQKEFTAENILKELRPLLMQATARNKQQEELQRASLRLQKDVNPAKAAATVILSYINKLQ